MEHSLNVNNGRLSEQQIQAYWEDGFVYPLTGLDENYAKSLVPRFFDIKARMGHWVDTAQLLKVHLVSRWVFDVASNPKILDAVSSILGNNILLWGATFFAKDPDKAKHVGWHQDLLYWGLQPADRVLTVWLALSGANAENGALQAIRGSHKAGLRQHHNQLDEKNMLMSGQKALLTSEDENERVMFELHPGQFSMHHSMTLHGSGPNYSDQPRVGLSINYIATDAMQLNNDGCDAAMLVRGEDTFGNFQLEQIPQAEFTADSIAQYRSSITMPSGLATANDVSNSIVHFDKIA